MRSSWLEDNISSKAWFDVRRPFAGQTFASQLLRCLCRFTSLTWLGRQGMLWTKPFPFSWAKSLADEYLTNGFISESSRLMQPCWQHGPTKDVEKLFKTSWANTTSCRLWWSHVIKLGFTPELSNKAVKLYRTPHVDEGSLVASDEADRGQVSNVAAKLVMKFMWLGEEFQVWNLRPSQSKMVFRKIDNSKALSSWMANLFSKNPGTEVPKTRIHGMNGIYIC